MANDTRPRCLRCGDLITPDGTEYRCVGCDIYTSSTGRKLRQQPTKAQKLRRYRARQLELDLGEAFGPMTQITQRRKP